MVEHSIDNFRFHPNDVVGDVIVADDDDGDGIVGAVVDENDVDDGHVVAVVDDGDEVVAVANQN